MLPEEPDKWDLMLHLAFGLCVLGMFIAHVRV